MAKQYFVKHRDAIRGPLSANEVKREVASGSIVAFDEIAESEVGPWFVVNQNEKLLALLPPAAAPSAVSNTPPAPSSFLVPCLDCGTSVSKRAKVCPACGAPVEQHMATLTINIPGLWMLFDLSFEVQLVGIDRVFSESLGQGTIKKGFQSQISVQPGTYELSINTLRTRRYTLDLRGGFHQTQIDYDRGSGFYPEQITVLYDPNL